MKIAGSSTIASSIQTNLSQKNVTTLLELIKPLSKNSALVKTALLGEITLNIKEPLIKGQLYEASLIKEAKAYTLLEALPLPQALQKALLAKPMMNIQQLLSELSSGKSPQKIALETISSQLSSPLHKEEVKELMSQLVHLAQTQEAIIPLDVHRDNAYVMFKPKQEKDEIKKLPFEAYFSKLGSIFGHVAIQKQDRALYLTVSSDPIKSKLEGFEKDLSMKLFISVEKGKSIACKHALLDIQA
jgi:hypothetical protein